MASDRLLWLAERLCGARARRNVFEPFVADWQRELLDARGRSRRGIAGLAIGRSRMTAPALSAATAWWFFAWMAYQLLQFLADRLRVVASAPIEAAIWIPPLAVLTVAIVALRFAERSYFRRGL